MSLNNNRQLTEHRVRWMFIAPAMHGSVRNPFSQLLEEIYLTAVRIPNQGPARRGKKRILAVA